MQDNLPAPIPLSEWAQEKAWKSLEDVVGYDPDSRTFFVNVAYHYPIPSNRIRSYAHLLQWVQQLSEKMWDTTHLGPDADMGLVVNKFIKLVCQVKNWNIYKTES